MHVLLPPSENKTPGGRGRPFGRSLPPGPLCAAREEVLDALATLLTGDEEKAARALLLPPGVAADALAADRAVRTAPTMPALRRYSGVVYDGLDLAGLSAPARRLAGRRTTIFSGLWGAVRGDEPVPAYRVPAKAVLPGIGVVGTFWRRVLDGELAVQLGGGLIVDLRSADYGAMWRPRGEPAGRTVTVRVLSPLPRGGHGVVSYNSKLAKGRLAAALFERAAAGGEPRTADDLARVWLEAVGPRAETPDANTVVVYTAAP